jgi:hypothetical protein
MDNQFKANDSQMKAQAASNFLKKLHPSRNQSKHEQMAISSLGRASNWAKEKLLEEETVKAFKDGIIPDYSPDTHDFRPKDKSKEIQKDIYLKHFEIAEKRAEHARKDFREGHLEQEHYFTPVECIERERVVHKEFGPSMRYGIRTENERLANHLNGYNRFFDPAKKDDKMMLSPSWKDVNKVKWISTKDFDLTTCHYGGKRSKDPWPVVPLGINVGESYADGFEVVGDLSRKRDRNLEISPKDFLTTVTPNHSSKPFLPVLNSTSLRTNKSMKFLNQSQTLDKKTYPKTLLTTTNADCAEGEVVKPSTPSSHPRIVLITTGSNFGPVKESLFSPGMRRTKSQFNGGESSPVSNLFGSQRKRKNLLDANRPEFIKQAFKLYFDEA